MVKNLRINKLYKRIMKHDPAAINEIETLEQAKEIIRMIESMVFLHGHLYQKENNCCLSCRRSLSGDALDGTQVLVCFDCKGHEGNGMIVGEEECCESYKGE